MEADKSAEEAELYGIVNACIVLEEENATGGVSKGDYEEEWTKLVDSWCTFRDAFWGPMVSLTVMKRWREACALKFNAKVEQRLFVDGSVDFSGNETMALARVSEYLTKMQDYVVFFKDGQLTDPNTRSDLFATFKSISSWASRCPNMLGGEMKRAMGFIGPTLARMEDPSPFSPPEMSNLVMQSAALAQCWKDQR